MHTERRSGGSPRLNFHFTLSSSPLLLLCSHGWRCKWSEGRQSVFRVAWFHRRAPEVGRRNSRRPIGSRRSASFPWDVKLSRQTRDIKADVSETRGTFELRGSDVAFVRPRVLLVEEVFFRWKFSSPPQSIQLPNTEMSLLDFSEVLMS